MLIKATLIVWEAVLIFVFVIEEYRNKTISLLFTYPVSLIKLIMAKLLMHSMTEADDSKKNYLLNTPQKKSFTL